MVNSCSAAQQPSFKWSHLLFVETQKLDRLVQQHKKEEECLMVAPLNLVLVYCPGLTGCPHILDWGQTGEGLLEQYL